MFIKQFVILFVIVSLFTQCSINSSFRKIVYNKTMCSNNVSNRIFYKKPHLKFIDSIRQTIAESKIKHTDLETYIVMDSLYNKIKTNRKKYYSKNIPSLLNVELNNWKSEKDKEVDVSIYVKQINHIRALHKLQPVKQNTVLNRFAKNHCLVMKKKVEIHHSSFEEELGNDYMETVAGITNYCRIFAWGPINAYYDSPDHKVILLNKHVKYIGIYSYIKDNYEYNVIIWLTNSIVPVNLSHKSEIQNR